MKWPPWWSDLFLSSGKQGDRFVSDWNLWCADWLFVRSTRTITSLTNYVLDGKKVKLACQRLDKAGQNETKQTIFQFLDLPMVGYSWLCRLNLPIFHSRKDIILFETKNILFSVWNYWTKIWLTSFAPTLSFLRLLPRQRFFPAVFHSKSRFFRGEFLGSLSGRMERKKKFQPVFMLDVNT